MAEPSKRKRHPALDLRVPFFRPIWRRIAVLVLLGGWTAVELVDGSPYWALLTGGIGIYAGWVFFFDFDETSSDD